MEEAARIAFFEHGSEKIVVISGVGTRDYYRKLGYELDGPYMSKSLSAEELRILRARNCGQYELELDSGQIQLCEVVLIQLVV
ncbi:hypothetical protein OSTOST_10475, partial [Ostertagia ostertagi]